MNNMKFSEMIVDAFKNSDDAHSIIVNSDGGWHTGSHVARYAAQPFHAVSKEYYNRNIPFHSIGNSFSNLKISESDRCWFNNSDPFKSLYHITRFPISSEYMCYQ